METILQNMCMIYDRDNNVEGKLFWMGIDEFKNADGKSYSIDKIFDLYLDDNYTELMIKWGRNDEVVSEIFF